MPIEKRTNNNHHKIQAEVMNKSNQIALFQNGEKPVDTVKEIASDMTEVILALDQDVPDLTPVFQYLKDKGSTTGLALCQIIELLPSIDWERNWNDFEETGQWFYYSFIVHGYHMYFHDGMRGVITDQEGNDLIVWNENDVFDKFMTKKIMTILKRYLNENQYQIELKFNVT